jgi:hypothetical protein
MILKTNFNPFTLLLCLSLSIFGSEALAGDFTPVGEYQDIFCNQMVLDTTIGNDNNYTRADYSDCTDPSELFNAGENVYKLVLEGTRSIDLEFRVLDMSTLELFILSNTIDPETEADCPDTCISRITGSDTLAVTLETGTYWIIVDGALGPDLSLLGEGAYELALRCEKDFTDISCGEIVSGSTVDRISNYDLLDYGACFESVVNTYEAGEQLFRFDVTEPNTIDISLLKDNPGLHLFLLGNAVDIQDGSSCPGACIGLSDTGSVSEGIHAILPIGTYWIVVDGNITPGLPEDLVDEGSFELSIACKRDFGTLLCQQPVMGNTATRTNNYSNLDYTGCPTSASYDGGDLIYKFELTVADEVTFTLNPIEGDDLDLFLMSSVEIDDDVFEPESCLAISDTSSTGVREVIKMDLAVGVYYLVVDGATVDGVSQAGPFMLTASCALLPVELVSFSGVPMAEGVELTWETASEINFEGFYIQRSSTGVEWSNIDWMDAKGSPDIATTYHYIDPNPLPGVNYFRLNSVDIDGSSDFSTIIQIDYRSDGEIKVYPSLATNQITISGVPGDDGSATYEMRSALGQLLQRGKITSSQQRLEVGGMTKGLIYLSIIDGSSVKTFPIRIL